MGHIFLSYAREDRAFAQRIAHVLEQAGHELWWDRRIDSGEEFSAEIEEALAEANFVLVAWSKLSIKSRWVRDEAAVGGDSGRLVPVSIDGSLPPMGFRQFHTMNLAGWKGSKRDERTAELLHSVERRLKERPKETTAAVLPPTAPPRLFALNRRWFAGIGAALVLVIAAAGVYMFISHRNGARTPSAATIALLPFTATSSDAALRAHAAQARDSVAHAFSDSGVPVKLIETRPSNGVRPAADYLISAELSADPKKTVATVRMEDAAQGVTVWTRQIEADGQDVANLPDRIGAQVAGTLSWSGTMKNLDPHDPDFTAKILQIDIGRDALQNYQNAVRLAARAPQSGWAQLTLAMYTAFALDELPRDQRAQAVAAARQAGYRAKSLMPGFGDDNIQGCLLYPDVQMAECEDRLRAGLKADPDAPFVNHFLAYLLNAVGRDQDALDRESLSYQHDPYMPAKISNMVHILEVEGEKSDANSLYLQGERWWPDWSFFRPRILGILERGDFDALRAVEQEPGAGHYGPPHPDSVALVAAVKARSLPQLKRTCADAKDYFYAFPCMLAFAKLGDLDSAYALADQLYPRRLGRTASQTERIWLDNPDGPSLEIITSAAAAPLRLDPRFLPLAERTGLLLYWRSGRPPDFCRPPQPEPICAELLKRS
jgi:TolB-like protein